MTQREIQIQTSDMTNENLSVIFVFAAAGWYGIKLPVKVKVASGFAQRNHLALFNPAWIIYHGNIIKKTTP